MPSLPFKEPEETPAETMATYLGCLDVMLGRPEDRSSLAERLVTEGFTVSDIKALERIVKNRKEPGIAIERELKDLKQARIKVDDVKKCDAAKKPAAQAPEVHAVDEACNQRKAYALVRMDRKTPEHVAKTMGVTVDQVNLWVDQERYLRYGDAPAKVKHVVEDTRTPEQRIADFRKFLEEKKNA